MTDFAAKYISASNALIAIDSYINAIQTLPFRNEETYEILVDGIVKAIAVNKETEAHIDEVDNRVAEVSSDK